MNILLTGQASLHWGRMEFGNIGNYYIIEPLIRLLHQTFPNVQIKTTLQMSERFSHDERITVLPLELYFNFSGENLQAARDEIKTVQHYLDTGSFQHTTPYILEVMKSDLVIEFSTDMWGDNANFLGADRFEVGLYKNMIPQMLHIPTVMLAGSPGPFGCDHTRSLAKSVYRNFDLVINREPASAALLAAEGFDMSKSHVYPCPSFLFEPKSTCDVFTMFAKEGIGKSNKPVVGFALCGWNFAEGPFNKWPRKDCDYFPFVEALEHFSCYHDCDIVLMSHSNGFPIPPASFVLQHGRDYPIIKQLQRIIAERKRAKGVFALDGVFDAWSTKKILGAFDMMVSGRVHAAIGALSQAVPTVILDYGHAPKAHKLLGFAKITGQERYVCDPTNPEDIYQKLSECFELRQSIKNELQLKMKDIAEEARQGVLLLKEIMQNKQ